MRVLGINDQHNASACLVEDGVITAALQEERITRIKNHFTFPHNAVRWVLESQGVDPDDLDAVAMSSLHISAPWTRDELLEWYANLHSVKTTARRALKRTPLMAKVKERRRTERLRDVARAGLPVAKTSFVDHHTAHAAAAYHGSPWPTEPVLVLTADGEGDGLSASVRLGQDGRLSPPLATVREADSLGAIYSLITYMQGMVPLEHEYKLMGMAPYAPPSGAARSYAQFKGVLEFDRENPLTWRRAPGTPNLFFSYRYFRKRLEAHRFDWIAAGLQRFTEEHLVEWARHAINATGVRRLALGGGVFMNVKSNQRILELQEVEELFVFPSCGDETNSMGAAFGVYTELARQGGGPPVAPVGSLYWGPDITDANVEPLISRLSGLGYHVERHDDIDSLIAEMLVRGEVVARARGRMEFGARALGNRSILADPTRRDVVRIINDMIKNRDFWMPFAPAMLAEESNDYIVNPKGMSAPYMIVTFDTTDRAEDFPAGIQPYDRTARPQMVTAEHNPDFHRLISRFSQKTGRSVVLNTSFNLHGFPIVSSAEQAVEVLEQSGLEHLAVGNFLITKPRTDGREGDGMGSSATRRARPTR